MEVIVRDGKQMAAALRRFRRASRMTQAQVAASAGVRQATISEVETVSPEANTATLYRILAALDLEIVIRPRTKGVEHFEDIF